MELRQDWRAFERVLGQVGRRSGSSAPHIVINSDFIQKCDRWMVDALNHSHYFDQISALKRNFFSTQSHFFLDVILPVWKKIFPSTFGVYLRIEGENTRSLLMVFHGGHLDGYWEPDLGQLGLGQDRDRVVKYLSEKHLVPIQGAFFSEKNWRLLEQSENPLKDFARMIRAEEAELVPKKPSLVAFCGVMSFFKK